MKRWDGLGPVATAVAALALLLILPYAEPDAVPDENPTRDAGRLAPDHQERGAVLGWSEDAVGDAATPLEVFLNERGEWCRELAVTVADGTDATSSRTACRAADGTWELRDRDPSQLAGK